MESEAPAVENCKTHDTGMQHRQRTKKGHLRIGRVISVFVQLMTSNSNFVQLVLIIGVLHSLVVHVIGFDASPHCVQHGIDL